MNKWKLYSGTVQAYVAREGEPLTMFFFGLPQYDRNKPVISEYKKEKTNKILDQLNNNEISEDEAKSLLKKIW